MLKVVKGRRKAEAKCSQDGAWILVSRTRCNFKFQTSVVPTPIPHSWERNVPLEGKIHVTRFSKLLQDEIIHPFFFFPLPGGKVDIQIPQKYPHNAWSSTRWIPQEHLCLTRWTPQVHLYLKMWHWSQLKMSHLVLLDLLISKIPVFQEVWVLLVPIQKTQEHGVSKRILC